MKLTVENILAEYANVSSKLPKGLTQEWDDLKEMIEIYGADSSIDEVVDLWLEKANAELAKSGEEPKPKKEPKVEPKFKVGDRVVRVTGLDKGTHKIIEIAVSFT